jgi:hypothetical protein
MAASGYCVYVQAKPTHAVSIIEPLSYEHRQFAVPVSEPYVYKLWHFSGTAIKHDAVNV